MDARSFCGDRRFASGFPQKKRGRCEKNSRYSTQKAASVTRTSVIAVVSAEAPETWHNFAPRTTYAYLFKGVSDIPFKSICGIRHG